MFRVQVLIISKIKFNVSPTWSAIKVATIINKAFITTYEPTGSITTVCCCSAIVTFYPPDVKIFVSLTKSPPWVKEVMIFQVCACVVCVTEALRMEVVGDSHVSWVQGEMLHVRQRQTVWTPVYFQWNFANRIINTTKTILNWFLFSSEKDWIRAHTNSGSDSKSQYTRNGWSWAS